MKHLKYVVVALVVLLVGMYSLVQTASASSDPLQAGAESLYTGSGGAVCADGSTPVTTTWDFTDGAEGWTIDNRVSLTTTGVPPVDWVLQTTTSPSTGSNSPSGGNRWFAADIEFGEDNALMDAYLISPIITIPTNTASLSFWNLQEFEISDGECWDSGRVEVSNDGGVTWDYVNDAGSNPITVTPAYDANVHTEWAGVYWAEDADMWCPSTPSPTDPTWGFRDWHEATVDLSGYAGETIQVRFAMFSDAYAPGYGWEVDDIETLTCATPTAVTVSTFDSGSSLPILPMIGAALLGLVAVGAIARRVRR
jgi:hypothetical protein